MVRAAMRFRAVPPEGMGIIGGREGSISSPPYDPHAFTMFLLLCGFFRTCHHHATQSHLRQKNSLHDVHLLVSSAHCY